MDRIVSLKFVHWSPNPQCDDIQSWDRKVIHKVFSVGPESNADVLIKKGRDTRDVHTRKKDPMRRQGEAPKPRREASWKKPCQHSWTESEKITFCCLRRPLCGILLWQVEPIYTTTRKDCEELFRVTHWKPALRSPGRVENLAPPCIPSRDHRRAFSHKLKSESCRVQTSRHLSGERLSWDNYNLR